MSSDRALLESEAEASMRVVYQEHSKSEGARSKERKRCFIELVSTVTTACLIPQTPGKVSKLCNRKKRGSIYPEALLTPDQVFSSVTPWAFWFIHGSAAQVSTVIYAAMSEGPGECAAWGRDWISPG